MKKILITATLAVCATFVQANDNPITLVGDNRIVVNLNEPTYLFSAVDMSDTIAKRLPNNHIFSRDKLTDRFCWELSNLPANKRLYNVDLSLTAPAMTTFTDMAGNRSTSTHHVTNLQLEAKEGRISECGMFEASDPAGTYTFQVTVEGKAYPKHQIILR